MSLENVLIYAFLASPIVLAILLAWVLFSAGVAYVLTALIAAAGAWYARGFKYEIDRNYRTRNWKWPS